MGENEEVKAPEETPITGAFVASLKRSNKDIRSDRAEAIAEEAQMLFEQRVKTLELEYKRLKRQQENMLDMSPANALSLMPAGEFIGSKYVAEEERIALEIRDAKIRLDEMKARYNYLFGGK